MRNRSLYKGFLTCFLGGLLYIVVELIISMHYSRLDNIFLEDFLTSLALATFGALVFSGCLAIIFSLISRSSKRAVEVYQYATAYFVLFILGYMFYLEILRRDSLVEVLFVVLVAAILWVILGWLVRSVMRQGKYWVFFICLATGLAFFAMKFLMLDYLSYPTRLMMAGVFGLVLIGLCLASWIMSWLVNRYFRATIGLAVVGIIIHVVYVSIVNGPPKVKFSANLSLSERPNILIILADTQRADHLGCYGYPYPTSPTIDSLAANGVLYENCMAQNYWSLPSHASLFTGLYYSQHQASQVNPYLDKRFATLAQVLKAAGYQTASYGVNPWLNRLNGMLRGFDYAYTGHYFSNFLFSQRLASIEWLPDILKQRETLDFRWIMKNMRKWFKYKYEQDRPFFMFINLIATHLEYKAPEPYFTDFNKGRFEPVDEEQMDEIASFLYPDKSSEKTAKKIMEDDNLLKVLRALYDGEVAFTDALVKEILDELERRGMLENTVVIFTSDHGDNIGDHGLFGHLNCLYEPLIHVPLIISHPRFFAKGERVAEPVQLIDVFSTIVGMLEGDAKDLLPEGMKYRGIDLRKPEQVKSPRIVVSETDIVNNDSSYFSNKATAFSWPGGKLSMIKAIREGDIKYLRYGDGREELFDLAEDPREENNLAAEQAELLAKMQQQLDAFEKSIKSIEIEADSTKKFDKGTRKRLQALGYIQ